MSVFTPPPGGGTSSATLTVTASNAGLQFYPLANPIRLLDTRKGFAAIDMPGNPLTGDQVRIQPTRGFNQATIPDSARVIVGNATVVNQNGTADGWVNLFPSDAPQRPVISNLNFTPGQVVPNAFTVGLGADGAFKIYSTTQIDFIVDITGYYAHPSAEGLFYHALSQPIRFLDTRSGPGDCASSTGALGSDSTRTVMVRGITCTLTIPASAKALVGNATVVNAGRADGGHIRLFPSTSNRPEVSNLNFGPGQVIPNAFTVALGSDGAFKVYSTTATHFVVDISGYYSTEQNDTLGEGLLYFPFPNPIRLLDTRTGEPACYMPGAALSELPLKQSVVGEPCSGNIPASARAVVGNATVVYNTPNASPGIWFITLFPSTSDQPPVSNLNFTTPGQVVPNAFTVRLGNDGAFKIYGSHPTNFIVDLCGYFSP